MTFLSCSNLAGGAASSGGSIPTDSAPNQIVTFTGRFASDGAYPVEIANASVTNASQQNLGSAAFPSLSPISTDSYSCSYTYFVEATDQDGNSVPAEKISLNQTTKTFEIPLLTGKTWTITCGVKKTETTSDPDEPDVPPVETVETVLQATYPNFTPSAANPVLNNQIFNLQHVGSGNGSINLTLNADSSIDHVVISCSDSAWQNAISVSSILFTDGSTTFEASDVPAGQYEVVMKFYTSSDVIKYTTIQTINVVPNMSTETWVAGDGGSGVISDTGAFNVSSTLISAANNREIYYVGQTAAATSKNITPSNSNDGSAYSPLASITGACTYIAANGKPGVHYKIYVEGTVTGHNEISNTITEDNAASITIEGYRGLDSTGLPQDVLDGGFTTDVIQGVVLMLSTPVPVTIKNLKITGGFPRSGGVAGGIYIWNTPTTLENCVITGNKTYGMGETTEYCAGVRIAPLVTSFTLKGKNIIKDNFKVGDDGIPYPANLYVGNSSKKIKISGDITGSEIGINVPYSGTSVPTAANPKVFTENYRYGTTNTALPGTIFTAENGYAVTRITGGGNAGEAAFAVSSGSMYTALDYDFSFTTSAVTAVVNTAKNVAVPVTVNRRESDGTETELDLADIADDITWTAALYNGAGENGAVAVDSNLTVTNTTDGISIAVPAIAYEGTYTIKVSAEYLGLTHDANFTLTVIPPYTLSTEPESIPAGTDGTAGTSATYVYFGDWPQTIKASDVEIDENTTKVQGAFTYYLGSDGNWYAKCLENANASGYTYSDGTAVALSSANSYKYFKVEPIKWRVLTTNYNGSGKRLLLAENALTSYIPYYNSTWTRTIGGDTVYANNYKESAVRAYLNGLSYINGSDETSVNSAYSGKGFLQTAFTSDAQLKIADTTVINDADSTSDATETLTKADGTDTGSTDYTCDNTEDKVFLLSENEVTTTEYGFGTYNAAGDASKRVRTPTDFTKANYASVSDGNCSWYLRSPHYCGNARNVTYDGSGDCGSYYVSIQSLGIVPAIVLEN